MNLLHSDKNDKPKLKWINLSKGDKQSLDLENNISLKIFLCDLIITPILISE